MIARHRCLDNMPTSEKKRRIAESQDDALQPKAVTWSQITLPFAWGKLYTASERAGGRYSVHIDLA